MMSHWKSQGAPKVSSGQNHLIMWRGGERVSAEEELVNTVGNYILLNWKGVGGRPLWF